jgi:hypothetical protein
MRRIVSALVLVVAIVAPGTSLAQISEKEATSQLKAAIKAELATLDDGIQTRGETAIEDLIFALIFVDAGIADGLQAALGDYLADLHALVDASMRNLEGTASTTLSDLGSHHPDFMLGSGGLLNGFLSKLAKATPRRRPQPRRSSRSVPCSPRAT